MRRRAQVTTACGAVLTASLVMAPSAAAATDPSVDDHFTGYRSQMLDDGDRLGPWHVVFDGVDNGPGVAIRRGTLILRPQSATSPDQTSSALVVSRRSFTDAPLHIDARWTTRWSTRANTPPNPWEVGWLVWDYVDNDHFTYLALKLNGWEIGRRDPTRPGGQRFIVDAAAPATPIGMARHVTVDRNGDATTVRVDREILATFTLPPDERHGAVGMYGEDAIVEWTHLRASAAG